jgi:hypothetical protein
VAREVAAALEKARGEDIKGEDTSTHEASSEPKLQYLLQNAKDGVTRGAIRPGQADRKELGGAG